MKLPCCTVQSYTISCSAVSSFNSMCKCLSGIHKTRIHFQKIDVFSFQIAFQNECHLVHFQKQM